MWSPHSARVLPVISQEFPRRKPPKWLRVATSASVSGVTLFGRSSERQEVPRVPVKLPLGGGETLEILLADERICPQVQAVSHCVIMQTPRADHPFGRFLMVSSPLRALVNVCAGYGPGGAKTLESRAQVIPSRRCER